MGNGLASQRRWPQGDQDPTSPEGTHNTNSTSEGSPNAPTMQNLEQMDIATQEETQPLGDGEGWGMGNYNSTASLGSLIPVERRRSIDSMNGGVSGAGGLVADDDDFTSLRDSRTHSTAYDLGYLSTEEEVSSFAT